MILDFRNSTWAQQTTAPFSWQIDRFLSLLLNVERLESLMQSHSHVFDVAFGIQHVLSRFRHVASKKKIMHGDSKVTLWPQIPLNSRHFFAQRMSTGWVNCMRQQDLTSVRATIFCSSFAAQAPVSKEPWYILRYQEFEFDFFLYEFEFVPIGQILRGIYVSPMIDSRTTHLTQNERHLCKCSTHR